MNNSPRKIELRRKQVSALLAQAVTEEAIAQKLNVDQSTISRDIKHLKVVSQKFVYDLAKSDLAFYYKQSIDGIQEVNKKAWELLRSCQGDMKTKLLSLKLAKECNEAIFSLFSQGPSVLNMKSLEDRLNKIESGQINKQAI
jgi:IS30 family transposase